MTNRPRFRCAPLLNSPAARATRRARRNRQLALPIRARRWRASTPGCIPRISWRSSLIVTSSRRLGAQHSRLAPHCPIAHQPLLGSLAQGRWHLPGALWRPSFPTTGACCGAGSPRHPSFKGWECLGANCNSWQLAFARRQACTHWTVVTSARSRSSWGLGDLRHRAQDPAVAPALFLRIIRCAALLAIVLGVSCDVQAHV